MSTFALFVNCSVHAVNGKNRFLLNTDVLMSPKSHTSISKCVVFMNNLVVFEEWVNNSPKSHTSILFLKCVVFMNNLVVFEEWVNNSPKSHTSDLKCVVFVNNLVVFEEWVNNCRWVWQNTTDVGKCTHQYDEKQGNNTWTLSTKVVFFRRKKIDRQQKKKEVKKRIKITYSFLTFLTSAPSCLSLLE